MEKYECRCSKIILFHFYNLENNKKRRIRKTQLENFEFLNFVGILILKFIQKMVPKYFSKKKNVLNHLIK